MKLKKHKLIKNKRQPNPGESLKSVLISKTCNP